ncbi:MAG: LysR family transcriptional regulator [Cytophaga sp.]|nr:LysR family transcriptional regulator [Undibacterium sp.]
MRNRNLDLDLLRSFVSVIENGGFTAAAEYLCRAQSTVSVQVIRLEEFVGHKLLERSYGKVVTTEYGEILLSYARRMLMINDETMLRMADTGMQGTLRLGVVEYLAPQRLPEIISKLRSAYPRLDLRLKIDLSGSLKRDLEEGKLDVVIAAKTDADNGGIVLFEEQLCWAVSRDSEVDHSAPLPMVFLPQPCFYRQAAIDALDNIGRAWVCAVTTMNISGVQAAVGAGLAIGVLSRTSMLPSMKSLTTDKQFPALPTFRVAVFSSKGEQQLTIKPLIDFIAQELVG